MAFKQRLTIASMYAFEEIGLQEIGNEIKRALPHLDCHTEYSKPDDVLVVKGNLGDPANIATIVSRFIEDQTNKDLLDMPRTRQLDMPIVLQDDGASATADTNEDKPGGLLALDTDSDEELIPHSHLVTQVTKFWLSSHGGIGCFAAGFHEVLTEIAAVTGTNIAVVDDLKGIQVSGNSAGDVGDALAKLTRIENPLSCLGNPKVGNMGIAPEAKATRYRIQNYSCLNQVALRRALIDQNGNSNIGVSQMFVTTSLSFDEESQSYKLPENLINPRSISNGPGKSRIWTNFTFQEVGKGDDFRQMEPTHPYLTAEKAKQVNEWVAEGNEIEAARERPEPPPSPPPESSDDTTLVPSVKKGPAIKTRRVIPPNPPNQSVPSITPATKPERAKTPDPVSRGNDAPIHRTRWKMIYGAELGNTGVQTGCPRPATPFELRDVADSFVKGPTPAAPKAQLPLIFDETKYGLTKSSHPPDNNSQNSLKAERKCDHLPSRVSKRPERNNLLIDVNVPATMGTNVLPTLRADQPALIPLCLNSSKIPDLECSSLESNSLSILHNNAEDLNGLVFGEECRSQNEPGRSALSQVAKPIRDGSISNQVQRLAMIEEAFLEQTRESIPTGEAPAYPVHFPGLRPDITTILTRRRLEELERGSKAEGEQPTDEVATREFHHIMNHKASKPGGKASTKALSKAKRQATLEDAWGMPKKPTKTQAAVALDSPDPSSNSMGAKITSSLHTTQGPVQQAQKVKGESDMSEYIKQLFEILNPTLEAVEYFPGSLSLEVQIGLALIPILPKTYREGLIPLNEWTQIMQPRTGVSAPTTKFIDRVTTSGLDVDHVVDLKTSKDEGKHRIFECEDKQYSIFYEFHCRSKADQLLIVVVDEQGKYSIKKPTEALGAVNVHFPGNIWDARVVVHGSTAYPINGDPEFEEAARYMVDHLWVQPDKSLIRLFTRLSKANHLTVEKVIMKRWTRHRYISSDDSSIIGTTTPDTLSSSGGRGDFATNSVGSKSAPKDTESDANSDHTESQDIWLQIMEVQDLVIASSSSDPQALRARCVSPNEMIRRGRQWYEVSLVSSTIEAILKTNADIEIGERTDDWCSTDLFGNDAILLHNSSPDCSVSASSPRPVATAIGAAGIGDLLRLTKVIVQRMDGVGFWNCGPCVDTARMSNVSSLHAPTIPPKAATSSMGAMVKVEQKSLDFDELESIQEVRSVGDTQTGKKSNSAFSTQKKEQMEKEYW